MLDNFPDEFRRDDEKVLNEFRQKQVNFDLEERKNEINNSRSLFVGALAGLLMAGVVGWFVLAPRYQSNNSDDVPVIARPQTPVKIQPVDPGDVELASQERTVYDIIEKRPTSEENDNIVVSAEEPNAQGIEQLVENVAVETKVENTSGVESLTNGNNVATTEPVVEQSSVVAVKSAPVAETIKETPVAKVEEPAPMVAETPKPEPVAKAEEKVEKTNASASVIKAGSWQVQLMSSPNKAAVEKSWATMKNKYSMLQNLPYEVESADLGAKGVFYRLKAGSFASKADADALCSQLKKAGGTCFTAKK